MQAQSSDAPVLRQRSLPLWSAAVVLVLYLVTLNPWVSPLSLGITAQLGGWDHELPVSAPLLYLVTLPLRLLPESQLPLAANLLTALLASAVVATLVRCVQLLPHDRTHAQRIRGHADGRSLDLPLAWVPAVLAAGTFAFQLTQWEHATSATGEMLFVLLLGTCIRLLLEFRRDQRESRLNVFALLLGLGLAHSWAMVGFAPFLLLALFWVGGWSMLRAGRLLRLAAFLGAGLLLFLLMPVIGRGRGGLPEEFGPALWALIQNHKGYLTGYPKARFLMLAAVMLLPLLLAGVRWASPRGSGLERMMSQTGVISLQLVWLAGNVWFAFDPFAGPRVLVTLSPGYGGLPLLTFHFCGALSVGYLAGYFLLLGLTRPDQRFVRENPALGSVAKALAGLIILASVAVPAALLVRNWAVVKVQNGPILQDLAAALVAPLPKEPVVVVTEDPFLHSLFNAQLRRAGQQTPHLAVNTRQAPEAAYRRLLAQQHGERWPELRAVASATENVGGAFLVFLNQASLSGKAFYLNPATTFLTEQNQLQPRGAIFQLSPYPPRQVSPTPLSDAEVSAIDAYWKAQAPVFARLTTANQRTPAAEYAATFWSRAANWSGVELQKNARLEPAGRLFALATNLVPENASARVNAAVNARLVAQQPIDDSVRRPIETYGPAVVEQFGPVDEPRFLNQFGDAVLTLGDPLVRASALAFLRARQLEPSSLDAAIGYARACIGAGEPDLALAALVDARALAARSKPNPAQISHLARAEANARMRKGEAKAAEQVLLTALNEVPTDVPVLDLITILYVELNQPAMAIPYVDRMLKLKADDESLLERKGYLLLQDAQFDAAIQTLDRLLTRRPDQTAARMNRGTAHLLAKHLDAAKEDFEGVLRRVPKAVDALVGLATVAEAKQDKSGAVRALEKALEILPEREALHTNLTLRLAALKVAP
jgi:tetratricopeptide (TPR) repeat protein